MNGWRAYSVGAFVGILAWHVIAAVSAWVYDGRHNRREGTYYEGPLIAALWGAPLSLFVGLMVAGLD